MCESLLFPYGAYTKIVLEYFQILGPSRKIPGPSQTKVNEIRFYLHEIRGYLVEIGTEVVTFRFVIEG